MDASTYLFSGTIGDAFVAMCKLHGRTPRAPARLRRMCRTPGVDAKIGELATIFPGVSYDPDYIHFDEIEAMRAFAFRHAGRYINIFFDGDGRGGEPDDPEGLVFDPRPQIGLPVAAEIRVSLGVNLQSGSRPGHQRQLAIDWVEALAAHLSRSERVEVVILGTGVGYADDELRRLENLPGYVRNAVGTLGLVAGLSSASSLDFLVSPEGLVPFCALSQGVPCLMLYEDRSALLRMPPEWRRDATCQRPERIERPGGARWRGPEPASLALQLLARFDPDRVP